MYRGQTLKNLFEKSQHPLLSQFVMKNESFWSRCHEKNEYIKNISRYTLVSNDYSGVWFISLLCSCHLKLSIIDLFSLQDTWYRSGCCSCKGSSWLWCETSSCTRRCWITLAAGNIIRPSDRKRRCHCSRGCPYWRTPALHNNTDRQTDILAEETRALQVYNRSLHIK